MIGFIASLYQNDGTIVNIEESQTVRNKQEISAEVEMRQTATNERETDDCPRAI